MSFIDDQERLVEKIARSLASYDLNLEDPRHAQWRYGQAYHLRQALVDRLWRDRVPQAKIIAALLGSEPRNSCGDDCLNVFKYSDPIEQDDSSYLDDRSYSVNDDKRQSIESPTLLSAFQYISSSLENLSRTLRGS
jgi:hypothetical protein